jgi:hypothetical protein
MPPPNPDEPDRPAARAFPTLPIVSLQDIATDQPPRSDSEKYGALFYLGTVGLAVIIALVSWFAWQAWSLRQVWTNVYILNDPTRLESERVQAGYAFAHDPAVNQRQRWDTALNRRIPPLARYVVAESLTAEAASADPRAYGVAVAKSEGWPVWLRLLMTRPMAYAAAYDLPVPRESLTSLARNTDRATALWATYALAEGSDGDPESAASLRLSAETADEFRPLALDLLSALNTTRLDDRIKALDSATIWLRTHHPDAAPLWSGWQIAGDRLIPAR